MSVYTISTVRSTYADRCCRYLVEIAMDLITMTLLANFGLDSFNHRSDPPNKVCFRDRIAPRSRVTLRQNGDAKRVFQ